MSADAPDPAGPPRAGTADVSFFAVLATFGAGLLVFGSIGARLLGLMYVGLAILLGVVAPRVRRPWATVRVAPVTRWCVRAAREIPARIGRQARWWILASGAAALAAAATLWDAAPAPMPQFFAALGLAVLAWALVWRSPVAAASRPVGIAVAVTSVLLGLGAFGGIAAVVWVYGTNASFLDEGIIFGYVLAYPSRTWPERAVDLVAPHISHRIATNRLVALAQSYVNGEVDFFQLTVISNLFLVGTVALVYWSLPKERRSPVLFAPFLLVLFQPQYYALTIWGFSIPHFSCLFFAALTFAFVGRETRSSFVIAALASVACAYTFATGVFASFIGLLFLIGARRYKDAVYWLVPGSLVALHYFENVSVDQQGLAARAFGAHEASLGEKATYLLDFVGSLCTLGVYAEVFGDKNAVGYTSVSAAWVIRTAGVVLLAAFIAVSAARYWRRNTTVYGLLMLTFIAAVLAADQRSREFVSPFLSRYALNSCLFAGLLYVSLLEFRFDFVRRRILGLVLLATVFCVSSWMVGLPHAQRHSANLRYAVLTASNNLYQRVTPEREPLPYFSTYLIGRGLSHSIYSIPEQSVLDTFASASMEVPAEVSAVASLPVKLLSVGENSFSYTFLLGTLADESEAGFDAVGVVLVDESGGRSGFTATSIGDTRANEQVIKDVAPEGTTHIAVIPKSAVPSGSLSVALLGVSNGQTRMASTRLALPTTWDGEALLSRPGLPELDHRTGWCLRTPSDPEGPCIVAPIAADSSPSLSMPAAYAVEIVVRTAPVSPEDTTLIWTLASPSSDPRAEIRLALNGEFLVVRVHDGTLWNEVTRLPVSPDRWTWCGVAVDGVSVTQFSSAFDPATGQLGALSVAQGDVEAPPLGEAAGLSILALAGRSGLRPVELREFRILAGVLKPEDIVRRWPPFRVP